MQVENVFILGSDGPVCLSYCSTNMLVHKKTSSTKCQNCFKLSWSDRLVENIFCQTAVVCSYRMDRVTQVGYLLFRGEKN